MRLCAICGLGCPSRAVDAATLAAVAAGRGLAPLSRLKRRCFGRQRGPPEVGVVEAAARGGRHVQQRPYRGATWRHLAAAAPFASPARAADVRGVGEGRKRPRVAEGRSGVGVRQTCLPPPPKLRRAGIGVGCSVVRDVLVRARRAALREGQPRPAGPRRCAGPGRAAAGDEPHADGVGLAGVSRNVPLVARALWPQDGAHVSRGAKDNHHDPRRAEPAGHRAAAAATEAARELGHADAKRQAAQQPQGA